MLGAPAYPGRWPERPVVDPWLSGVLISLQFFKILLFMTHWPTDAQKHRQELHMMIVHLLVIRIWWSRKCWKFLNELFLMDLILKPNHQYCKSSFVIVSTCAAPKPQKYFKSHQSRHHLVRPHLKFSELPRKTKSDHQKMNRPHISLWSLRAQNFSADAIY
jgi:hypothetical protein